MSLTKQQNFITLTQRRGQGQQANGKDRNNALDQIANEIHEREEKEYVREAQIQRSRTTEETNLDVDNV